VASARPRRASKRLDCRLWKHGTSFINRTDEAGDEAVTALDTAGAAKASNMADTAAANEPMDSVAGPLKRGEADSPVLPGSPKKQRVGDDQPTTPKDDRMDPSGERAPKTPRLEDSPDQQRMLQVTSTDLGLYEREDAPVKFDFNNDDVDRMEKYELEFYDDQFLHEDDPSSMEDANMAKIMEQLTFPHSAKEPELIADELLRLDALADQLELQRLERLQVLQSPDVVPPTAKVLSTRFVRTWREKHNSKGEAIWLRRSRFVAREFAWLAPERESLFSPASGSIISRIFAYNFVGKTREGKHGDGQLGCSRCFSDCEAGKRHPGPYNRCQWSYT